MTVTVLVVGPGTVSGPNPVPDELICAAIDAIDDEYTLLRERPIGVDELWASIITRAVGDTVPGLLLVCPGWWSDTRVARIRAAAGPHRDPAVLRRHEVLGSTAGCRLEIAPDFVLCRMAGRPAAATPRLGEPTEVVAALVRGVPSGAPVLIDAPVGVPGAAELAAMIAGRLRGDGHTVEVVDDRAVAAAGLDQSGADRAAPAATARRRKPWALTAGALLTAPALVTAGWLVQPGDEPMALITEGRVTVRLPAGWEVRRITDGAGSPRLQAVSPADRVAAILLTQSPAGPDLAGAAVVLKSALELQPAGVFTDFRDDDRAGDRDVVSYTEIRDGREIAWAVFIDGPVRIAIGCQQSTSHDGSIRKHCDEAIRSAHSTS